MPEDQILEADQGMMTLSPWNSPGDVAAQNELGVVPGAARPDHRHRGVASIQIGETPLRGNLEFLGDTDLNITSNAETGEITWSLPDTFTGDYTFSGTITFEDICAVKMRADTIAPCTDSPDNDVFVESGLAIRGTLSVDTIQAASQSPSVDGVAFSNDILLGANGIGRAAPALTFDSFEDATFVGSIALSDGFFVSWDAGTSSIVGSVGNLNYSTSGIHQFSGAVTMSSTLTMSGNILLQGNGIGNNASVLTFAVTGSGLATFGGAVTAEDHFGPDGVTYGISGNELITFNAAGTIDFAADAEFKFTRADTHTNADAWTLYTGAMKRVYIDDNGHQFWNVRTTDGTEVGQIAYGNPAGQAGILFVDSAGNFRSDFRHISSGVGGFDFYSGSGTSPTTHRFQIAEDVTSFRDFYVNTGATQADCVLQSNSNGISGMYRIQDMDSSVEMRFGMWSTDHATLAEDIRLWHFDGSNHFIFGYDHSEGEFIINVANEDLDFSWHSDNGTVGFKCDAGANGTAGQITFSSITLMSGATQAQFATSAFHLSSDGAALNYVSSGSHNFTGDVVVANGDTLFVDDIQSTLASPDMGINVWSPLDAYGGIFTDDIGSLQESPSQEINVWTGLLKVNGSIDVGGGQSVNYSVITSSVVLDGGDYVSLCDASGGAFTVTLPTAADHAGQAYYIKKIDSSANAITVDGNGSTIDGDATADIPAQYEAWKLVSDGSNWHVL